MAIPFFIARGRVDEPWAGITPGFVGILTRLSWAIFPGRVAHVKFLSSMLFAGLFRAPRSPTPHAAGSMLIPAMEKQGYTRRFAAAVTRLPSSQSSAPIIRRSGIMIIYAYVQWASERSRPCFSQCIVPGFLSAFWAHGRMVMAFSPTATILPKVKRIVRKGQTPLPCRNYIWFSFRLLRTQSRTGWSSRPSGARPVIAAAMRGAAVCGARLIGPAPIEVWGTFAVSVLAVHFLLMGLRKRVDPDFRMVTKRAVVPLQTPILILGGILLGVFTPTEAATVAVAYALVVGFFILGTMRLRDMPDVLSRSAMTSAVVLLLVGAAMAFKTVVSLSYAPQILADFILALSENPYYSPVSRQCILLFICGHVFGRRDPRSYILGDLAPYFTDLGVHSVHFRDHQ